MDHHLAGEESGNRPCQCRRVPAQETDCLRWAADRLAREGVTAIIEPINTRDIPGYYLNTTAQAMPIIEALNGASLLADALGHNLADTYRRIYSDQEPRIASGLGEAARLVIERIASSDAPYHDCEHTALVTLCVQDILRGRRLERIVTPSDWGHTILAALTHDIGYVRGICAGDTPEHYDRLPEGSNHTACPAWLAPSMPDGQMYDSFGHESEYRQTYERTSLWPGP